MNPRLSLLVLSVLAVAPLAAAAELGQDQWVTIGEHGCWGMPEITPTPGVPNSLLITWQRYRNEAETLMDVKYATLDLRSKKFTPENYLMDPKPVQILQAHPAVAFWHGGWRLFYCECLHGDPRGRIVEISAARWHDFHQQLSCTENTVTSELGFHSHVQFLPLTDSCACLFYTTGNRADKIGYSNIQPDGKWNPEPHPVPTGRLVGVEKLTLGSTFLEGSDVVLYSSTYEIDPNRQNNLHGIAWRFRCQQDTSQWTADKLTVTGIDEPFQKAGMFFVRVVKMGGTYYLSAQSNRSHRYLAAGKDGLHFKVIRDFGERPALGNAMIGLDAQKAILLVYADASNGLTKLGGRVECLLVPVGE
jgi:hypothetical protein